MDIIVTAAVSVTAIGIACAAVLSIASKLMAVNVDEHIAQILEGLPGTNCGSCGFPGCGGYAKALAANPPGSSSKGVKGNLCTPGGAPVAEHISAVMGIKAEKVTLKYAAIHCRGDSVAQKKKMDYTGIESCAAAKQLFGGEWSCAFGCLGFGDCQKACPSNAVCMENDLARINTKLCTGCGLCVRTCPNKLIEIINIDKSVYILCKNTEKGAITRKKCTCGCISCGKCVRECPAAAITIEDNLARIDYEKCTRCGHCADVCVTKCIHAARIIRE
jgi:Na+-translocating ferredoxin:NAD+ oxidoreductase RNF subunit RnfB